MSNRAAVTLMAPVSKCHYTGATELRLPDLHQRATGADRQFPDRISPSLKNLSRLLEAARDQCEVGGQRGLRASAPRGVITACQTDGNAVTGPG